MVEFGPWVAVQLDIGVSVIWNPIDIRIPQEHHWLAATDGPVRKFAVRSCKVINGPEFCR